MMRRGRLGMALPRDALLLALAYRGLGAQNVNIHGGAEERAFDAPPGAVAPTVVATRMSRVIDTTTAPATCRDAVNAYVGALYDIYAGPGQVPAAASVDSITRVARSAAGRCVTRFRAVPVHGDSVLDLAELALTAGADSLAAGLVRHWMAGADTSRAAQAMRLRRIVALYATDDADTILARQAALATSLDALVKMGPGVEAARLGADAIGVRYLPEAVFRTAAPAMVQGAVAVLHNDTTRAARRAAVNAVVAAARGYMSWNDARSATAVLAQVRAALADAPLRLETAVSDQLRTEEKAERIVGQPAGMLPIDVWLNASASGPGFPRAGQTAAGTPTYALTGAATLIAFTTPRCAACRQSYAALERLGRRAAAGEERGRARVVVLTQTLGKFAGKLFTVPGEVENDRTYYGHQYGLTVPIGVYTAHGAGVWDWTWDPYDVDELVPTYIVVDAQGVVRTRLEGWQPRYEAVLAAAITQVGTVRQ